MVLEPTSDYAMRLQTGKSLAIEEANFKVENLDAGVFKAPYYRITFDCDGCSCSCGGGHCSEKLEEIDSSLQHYTQTMEKCLTAKMKNRQVTVTVSDFRTHTPKLPLQKKKPTTTKKEEPQEQQALAKWLN